MAENDLPCPYCDKSHHYLRCPRIKALSFNELGQIIHIEFFEPQLPVKTGDYENTFRLSPNTTLLSEKNT